MCRPRVAPWLCDKRRGQRLIGVQARDHIDDQEADQVGSSVVTRIDGYESRKCLHHGIGAGLPAKGAPLPIAAHGKIEDARITLIYFRVAEAQPIGHAGAKAFDENVRLTGKLLRNSTPVGVFQIQGDAALAAIPADIQHRVAAVVGTEPACPVPFPWLDLDDVGTVERHQGAAIGPREPLTHVENLQAVVRTLITHAATVEG